MSDSNEEILKEIKRKVSNIVGTQRFSFDCGSDNMDRKDEYREYVEKQIDEYLGPDYETRVSIHDNPKSSHVIDIDIEIFQPVQIIDIDLNGEEQS